MKNQYIKAISALLLQETNPDVVFKNLVVTLKKHGHMRLHAQILYGVQNMLLRSSKELIPVVTVARNTDAQKFHKTIKQTLASLTPDAEHSIVVDPTIVGGFTAEYDGVFVDRSYKQKLITLYRSIITH